jgi:Ni,Fe-hydrogenase maturation factor
MKKIFVFGNPLVEGDSLALAVAERLKGKIEGIEFVAVQSLDEVGKRDFWVLDVAFGIEKVEVIEELDYLRVKQPVSGHDFDLALELKMLKKLGRIGEIRIIAVPMGYRLGKAVEEVKAVLEKGDYLRKG